MSFQMFPEYLPSDAPLDARQRQLEERRKQVLAEVARASGIEVPEGRMVSGIYVKPSALEALAPAVARAVAGYEQGQLNRAQNQYTADEQQQVLEYLKRVAQPVTQNLPGPTESGEPLTGVRPRNRQENLALYGEGMQIPSLRGTITKAYEDQLVQEPIREEARQEKALDRQIRAHRDQIDLVDGPDGQVFAVNRQQGTAVPIPGVKRADKAGYQLVTDDAGNVTAVSKKYPDKQIEVGRVGRTTVPPNYTMVTGPTGTVTAVNPRDPTKTVTVGDIGKPSPASKLSDAARRELDSLDATESGIAGALSKLRRADSSGTGYLAGLVQEKLPGGQSLVALRRSKDMNDAIQQLTYYTDEIRHGRFGATLTKEEKNSAAQYLPSEYDDKDALVRKTEGIQRLIRLNSGRLRQMGRDAKGGGGQPVQVKSLDEARKLSPGTVFIDPNGVRRTR